MEGHLKAFIRSSLSWLGVGVLIGVSMAIWPGRALAYRPAHVHANLLGFVTMMIAGIAYHVIPRFTGNALHSRLCSGFGRELPYRRIRFLPADRSVRHP